MIKDILVPVFGVDADGPALAWAHAAAQLFGSHIDCLHVRPGLRETALATATVGGAGMVTQELWDALQSEDQALAARATQAFDVFRRQYDVALCKVSSKQPDVTASLFTIEGERSEQIAIAARTRELIVLNHVEEAFTPSVGQLGQILMGSGRPILLTPPTNPASFANHIAIAWNDSPEAGRAVTAAMPFLAKAKAVTIITVTANASGEAARQEAAERLAHELKWHGIAPTVVVASAKGKGDTQALIGAVTQAGADLLVMGAYGHSRVMEFVLGGVTRDLLEKTPLPVFLFH